MPRPIRNLSKPTATRAAELPTVKASKMLSPTSNALNGKRVVLDDSLRFGFTSTHGPSFSVTREGGKKKGDDAFTMNNEFAVMHRTNAFETNLSVVLPESLKKGDVFKLKSGDCKFEIEIGLDVDKWRAKQAKAEAGWKAPAGGKARGGGVGGASSGGGRSVGGGGSGGGRGVGGRGSSATVVRPSRGGGGVGGSGSGARPGGRGVGGSGSGGRGGGWGGGGGGVGGRPS
jgi:hypothetical protein